MNDFNKLPARILRGVTRTVRLVILDGAGNPVDLSQASSIILTVAPDAGGNSVTYKPEFTIGGASNNVLSFAWYADMQQRDGRYTFTVVADYGDRNIAKINWHGPTGIELVEYNVDESGTLPDNVEIDNYIELTGSVTMNGVGMSAYEFWLAEGHGGSVADFLAWLRQPAEDAATDAEARMDTVQDRADEDHTRAEQDHTTAGLDHTRAESDHTRAETDHQRAETDHTTAGTDHITAGADHTQAASDHQRAETDHTTAGSDHTQAESDHTTAGSDHTQAESDHTRAEADHAQAVTDSQQAAGDHTRAGDDHDTAVADHQQAEADHSTAAADHTLAASDHSTAAADHTQALADHEIMEGYDTRLTNVEGEVTQLGQAVDVLDDIKDDTIDAIPTSNLFDKSQAMIQGYISGTTGALTPDTSGNSLCSYPIPILPNRYYYLSGRTSGVSATNIRCLASDGTTVMKVLKASTGAEVSSYALPKEGASETGGILNGQFKTPDGAAFVQFIIRYNGVGVSDNIMLTDLGENYQAGVPAPAYQPYGYDYRIKESALPKVRQPLKILLIGSSHGLNTSTQFPFIAWNSGIDIIFGNVYDGSMSMQNVVGRIMHNRGNKLRVFEQGVWTNTGTKQYADIISFTDWDIISLQRGAGTDSVWFKTDNEMDAYLDEHPSDATMRLELNINRYETGADPVYMNHNKAFQYLIDVVRRSATNNPTIVMNSGFADANAFNQAKLIEQTEAINASAKVMQGQFGIHYIPVATGVMNARLTYMRHLGAYVNPYNGDHNLAYDGQHLDFGIGCYVAGVTFLEYVLRLSGKSVLSLKGYGSAAEIKGFLDMVTSGMFEAERYTEPNEETMMIAKACAMCACDTPDTITSALGDRFKWQVTYDLGSGITSSETKGYSTDGDVFMTTLAGTITSVTVTMGGVDITATAYSGGVVTIGSVTGDIAITAS